MRITQSQMVFFQARAEESFVERVVAHLSDRHAVLVAGIGSGELEGRVKAAIARGRRHGFTWESSLAWFVEATSQIEDEGERIEAILDWEEG